MTLPQVPVVKCKTPTQAPGRGATFVNCQPLVFENGDVEYSDLVGMEALFEEALPNRLAQLLLGHGVSSWPR